MRALPPFPSHPPTHPPTPPSRQVWDYDVGPQDDLLGVMQLYFTDEVVETDPDTGGQRVVYKPK